MFKTMRTAALLFAALTIVTGIIYPLAVTGIAKLFFPYQASGSVLTRDGTAVGSALLGRSFDNVPGCFHGRPSSTEPFPYNPASSRGSNLSPKNPALREMVKARAARLRAEDPGNLRPIPIDLVTSSGSGLDPHISPEAAEYQVGRVARERRMDEKAVRALVAVHTRGRSLGILGEPRVNVLELNLALDEADGARTARLKSQGK